MHVRKAVQGDRDSLSWLLSRFTPILMAQASFRIGKDLRAVCDAEDLVNDVWVVALGKLADLPSREGRFTPVFMKFLSTTLLNRLQTLLKKHIFGKPARLEAGEADAPSRELLDVLPAETRGVVTRVLAREEEESVTAEIMNLDPADRDIIVLRGIEQNPTRAVASILGIEEATARVRYHRALQKLRDRLPASIFEEFPEDS